MALSELLLSVPSDFDSIRFLLFLASFVGIITAISRRQGNRTAFSDFQGPSRLPIFGNLRELASNGPEKCRHWATKHGDVLKLHLGNVPVLVVNTAAAAKQIFQSHSQNLGSRPSFYTHHQVSTTKSAKKQFSSVRCRS
jgi:3-hydroxyphenylacetate 6-hydroxylase